MPQRRLLTPGLMLVVGIVVLFVGLARASSDTVSCGGRSMAPGDECIQVGQDRRTTYEQELAGKHRTGWLIAAVGGVITGGSGFGLYWSAIGTRRRDERVAHDRAALGTAQGWTYLPLNPKFLRRWSDNESLLVTDSAAWNVLSGTTNGRRFHVFDGEIAGELYTMCAVPLGVNVPEVQVTLATERKLLRTGLFAYGDKVGKVWGEPAARAMVTPAVMEQVRAYNRGFALVGQSLVVIEPRNTASRHILRMVDQATTLAAMVATGGGRWAPG